MKKLAVNLIRTRGRFYLRLLQWLGFASAGFLVSCVKYGTPEPMYGVVENTMKFYGKVQSADSLKNITGIQLVVVPDHQWDSATTVTHSDGTYSFYYYAYEGDHLQLKLVDTDSTANGGDFENKTIDLDISGRDYNNMEKETNVLLDKK